MITENTNAPSQKQFQDQRFEFVLYINNHIICQRGFNIVGYNPESIHSYEMKELMDKITGINNGEWGSFGIIPNYLRKKTLDYLWENYNPYDTQEEENKTGVKKVDNFQFEIRVDKVCVAKSEFSGNIFPPKVKYAVNIKEIIHSIMTEISHSLSRKKYNKVENYPLN